MTVLEIVLAVLLVVVVVLSVANSIAAYKNGCVDGYGFSREPNCPGYRNAGQYLKTTMKHRWHELEG